MPSTPVVVLGSTLTNIADAIRDKNGSSDTYKPSEMPAAITAIPSGGGGGIPREVNASGVYGFPTQSFTFSLPSDATNMANSALYYAFNGCTTLTSVDLSSLTTVDGTYVFYYAFSGCTSLTSADLGSLVTVNGASAFNNAFRNCSSLTSVDLSSLATIGGYTAFGNAFLNCSSLTSVNFSSLTTISGGYAFSGAFVNCAGLTSLSFPALTSSSFGSGTDQFANMLANVAGCTIHFPAAAQAKIETLISYPNFGGTNTTVLFDL